jgi:outer membrane biosynthesis protein TonB
MDSTLKNIRSQTYDYVTNPTYMSYILIGLSTGILGYYTVFDKGDSEAPASEEEAPEQTEAHVEEKTEEPANNSLFGGPTEEKKEEPENNSLFGPSTEEEPVPTEQAQEEEPKEEPTIGGKKKKKNKKTRRERKQAKKLAKKSRKHN